MSPPSLLTKRPPATEPGVLPAHPVRVDGRPRVATFPAPTSLRRARRFLAGDAGRVAADGPLAKSLGSALRVQASRLTLAQGLLRGFYAFAFYLAVANLSESGRGNLPPDPLLLWPVAWLGWVGAYASAGVQLIGAFLLVGTGLAALFVESRTARAVGAFAWLEHVALHNSSEKIVHNLHLVVIISAVLVFLPRGWHLPASRLGRVGVQRVLGIFWACQAALLLTYSLSGLGKLAGSLYQVALGQTHGFSPFALAYHVADRLLQTASLSVLGDWLIRFPWAGWPAMLATVYLQFFAFAIAFRPSLQRWWAAGLIGFHLASFFTMTINFPQNCFLLALLFFRSPFAPTQPTPWSGLLAGLPVFGPFWRRLRGTFPRPRVALG